MCYRVELPEREWLRGVAEAVLPLTDYDEGVTAYAIDLDLGFADVEPLALGTPSWQLEWRSWWDRFMRPMPLRDVRTLHTLSAVSHATELLSAAAAQSATYAEFLASPHGRTPRAATPSAVGMTYPDSLNLCGLDASGHGAALVINMPKPATGPLDASARALWCRLAAHLAAGLRLVRRLRGGDATVGAEAIITPSGSVAHVDGALRDNAALDALRERVVAIDRARARLRGPGDAPRATEVWAGLTSGRWSLLDVFERDGRRFYVARANAPEVERGALSEREAQVSRAAALGHSNKLIAYELGVSTSTVAKHLKTAATKLGATSRLELIRKVRAPSMT